MGLRDAHESLHGLEAHHEAAEQYAVRGGRDGKLVLVHGDHAGIAQLSGKKKNRAKKSEPRVADKGVTRTCIYHQKKKLTPQNVWEFYVCRDWLSSGPASTIERGQYCASK